MFRNLRKKITKILNWKKKSKMIFFLTALVFFCPLYSYISKSTYNFDKKITYIGVDLKKVP